MTLGQAGICSPFPGDLHAAFTEMDRTSRSISVRPRSTRREYFFDAELQRNAEASHSRSEASSDGAVGAQLTFEPNCTDTAAGISGDWYRVGGESPVSQPACAAARE